ncbi:conserved hypothetical protein [Candidatus Desulfarcum epimagneticum]|uniref:Tetratricopeptide repeat-like domain-containing protein n=1 Tax=uncultured Desulfobacteraceae bacterium TaxID=218296 RepID=A0A484HP71_9BACT|nr:conserved hypothetical protein [uncultured Desulfobacteraceae bacterium]
MANPNNNKKVSRKELLNEPDEFIHFSKKALDFIVRRKVPVLSAVVGFFAILAAVALIRSTIEKSETASFEMLNQAAQKYQEALSENDEQKAYLAAKEHFEAVIEKYPGKGGGKLAKLAYADLRAKAGEIDGAIALYQTAIKDFADRPDIRAMALNGLAYAFEAKKDYKAAATHFERLTKDPGYPMEDEALFNAGRMWAAAGDAQKSAAFFKRLKEEQKDSPYARLTE